MHKTEVVAMAEHEVRLKGHGRKTLSELERYLKGDQYKVAGVSKEGSAT